MKKSKLTFRPDSIINDAWLGLGDLNELDVVNPLVNRNQFNIENPGLLEVELMRSPDYLSFAAKVLLGVEMLPEQSVVLSELWNRPFPMYIGSRGLGKMLSSDTPIRIKDGWTTMSELKEGDYIYGGDGKLTKVVYKTDLQKGLKFYKITLRDGRTIRCCEDHLWKVWNKNKNRYKDYPVYDDMTTKDMAKNFKMLRKGAKSNGTEFRYALPINKPLIEETTSDLIIHPYVVGCLLGDGTITQKHIVITSKDQELLDRFESLLPEGYKLSKPHSEINYAIIRTNKDVPTFYKLCEQIGIYGHNSHTKFIPKEYQYASYEQRLELIKGLMDCDGYADQSTIEYYTVSKALSDDFLNVIRSLGIHCKHSMKTSYIGTKRYTDCHRIRIYTDQPIFSLSRKAKCLSHIKSKQGNSKHEKVFIINIEEDGYDDGYCISVDNVDKTYITKDYIVTHNTWMFGVLAILKCVLIPGSKIVGVGSGLRQSRMIFDYMVKTWNDSPVLRSVCNNDSGPRTSNDRATFQINDSIATFLPIGDGKKIRGMRAHMILVDEFSSFSPEIFETVVSGFAAVSARPVDNVKGMARKEALKKYGRWTQEDEETFSEKTNNQIIITGTADYDFLHFAEYWRRYYVYIHSKNDPKKKVKLPNGDIKTLMDYFPEGVPPEFNYKDYSIMRIPYELIPKGFMDDKVIARARGSNTNSSVYLKEYGGCFPSDSDGFFKRSLIESCVANENNMVKGKWPAWCPHPFDPLLRGSASRKYVIAVDPAASRDNFAVVVLEIWPEHQRVVYVWSTNLEDFNKRKTTGLTEETEYYSFCARKIRNLAKVFPTEDIVIDGQGGGIAIIEALHDTDKLEPGEVPFWPTNKVMAPDKDLDTDGEAGEHIIHIFQFANADNTSEANHGTRKDLEDKVLLFPRFDAVSLELAAFQDGKMAEDLNVDRLYDTLEDATFEVDALKDELATIVMSKTSTGANARDRWDTPETTTNDGKKGRMRKDRYSALVMGNFIARKKKRAPKGVEYNVIGGFSKQISSKKENQKGKKGQSAQQMYSGPAWYVNGLNAGVYRAINRK